MASFCQAIITCLIQIAIFQYFQEIMPVLVIEWLKPPVIDDEELGSGQSGEHSSIAAIGSGDAQFLKESGYVC